MKKVVLGALLLSMLNIVGTVAAATSSATLEVSFVVKESCSVQLQNKERDAAPTVACGHNAPYQLSRRITAPAQPASQENLQADGQTWQITF